MKIEVGKSYRNRVGDVVTIVKVGRSKGYPFLDELGFGYTVGGKILDNDGIELDLDLVSVVQDPPL